MTDWNLAVNTAPTAAGLNQQGHTELHKQRLHESWGGQFQTCFNDVEHWTLPATGLFSAHLWNEYCKSCNFWSKENMSVKFSRLSKNLSHVYPEILVKKPLLVVKKLHLFVQWDIFWANQYKFSQSDTNDPQPHTWLQQNDLTITTSIVMGILWVDNQLTVSHLSQLSLAIPV